MSRKLCFASLLLFLSIPLTAQLVTIPTIAPPTVLSETTTAAAQPTMATPWASKRIPEWTERDAYLILSDSPWAKKAAASLARLMTAGQRREGGDMAAQGGGHGGIGLQNAGTLVGRGSGGAIVRPGQGAEGEHLKLAIRWECAMPVRAAELRTHDDSAPEIDGEDYAIAVYDVSLKLASIEDMKTLEADLKRIAVLRIEGRSEVKPSRVIAVMKGGGVANIIYLFPRSAHITAEDQRLTFEGQVGRILFAQYFYPADMKFLGKLEL
jgi:hypothetical protein